MQDLPFTKEEPTSSPVKKRPESRKTESVAPPPQPQPPPQQQPQPASIKPPIHSDTSDSDDDSSSTSSKSDSSNQADVRQTQQQQPQPESSPSPQPTHNQRASQKRSHEKSSTPNSNQDKQQNKRRKTIKNELNDSKSPNSSLGAAASGANTTSPQPLPPPPPTSVPSLGATGTPIAPLGRTKDEYKNGENSNHSTDSQNSKKFISPPPTSLSNDYMSELKELQHKIMNLQDNNDLQQVVEMIAATGQYEITSKTFDFDLCALDRSTVERLVSFFHHRS